MRKVTKVLQLIISKAEEGLWYDSDLKVYDSNGWGICLKFYIGKVIRPVPKFWIKGSNPWRGDDPWFVIRIPFVIVPFLSIAIHKFGFYIGFKTFNVEEKHRSLSRYGKWMRNEEFGSERPATYLTLSVTIRRTRDK